MTLLDKRDYYKPFKYSWAYDAYKEQSRMHWLPEEVSLREDVQDWNHKLTQEEKNLLSQIFKFFTQADVDVAGGYLHKYIPVFGHQPELAMMLSTFASLEAIHQDAYSLLMDTVGMPESDYKAFKDYKEMADKHEYLEGLSTLKPEDTDDEETSKIKKIARELAIYSAFTEGLQLFSSFAILLNFTRYGKMKGMGKIVTWSVRDECYSDDTEILTSSGWKLFKDLQQGDLVAQVTADGSVGFVYPKSYITNSDSKTLIRLYNTKGNIDLLVTPRHDIVHTSHGHDILLKTSAANFTPHYRRKFVTSGKTFNGSGMTPEERVLVALQADGSIPKGKYRNGNHCGYRKVVFSLKKERKIKRLQTLLDASTFEYTTKIAKDGDTIFYVNIPVSYPITKDFKDWVRMDAVSNQWASDFIEEVLHWDGHDRYNDGSVIYYSSTNKDNTDVIQGLAAICGKTTAYSIQVDNRKESYKDIHRLWIYDTNIRPTGSVIKEEVPYTGNVYCVTVPSGNIIVRRNNCVVVSGNSLHVKYMIRLFREFISENYDIWTDDFKKEIYDACRKMVELEDAFIDLAFSQGGIEGLTADEVKQYIRYLADRRLLQLGLKTHYKVKHNPLPWLDEILNSVEHTNFFENRVTEYQKASMKGSWNNVWGN